MKVSNFSVLKTFGLVLLIALALVACSGQTKEAVVSEVLIKTLTYTEKDIIRRNDDLVAFSDDRVEELKSDFTDKGLERITMNRITSGLPNNYGYTTIVDDLSLDFRETSQENELTCYYELTLTTQAESEAEPYIATIVGEMTLCLVEDKWLIEAYMISSRDSYYIGLDEYMDKLKSR